MPTAGHGDNSNHGDSWRQHLISAGELLDTSFPEMEWIVPTIIPTGLTILGGGFKAGKSWLALDIALAAGSASRILGAYDCSLSNVLYIALEDNGRRLKTRLTKLLPGLDPD